MILVIIISLTIFSLLQFADMFQRIECYRDMFLSQTQILTLQPLVALTKEFEKAKVSFIH